MSGALRKYKGPIQMVISPVSGATSAAGDYSIWDVEYAKRTALSALGTYALTLPDCNLIEFTVNVQKRYVIPTSTIAETVLKIGTTADKTKYGFAHISAIGQYRLTVSAPNLQAFASGSPIQVILSAKSTGINAPEASLYTRFLIIPD